MSSLHEHEPHVAHAHHEPWIDRWWPLMLILLGLIFTLCLTLFRPGDKEPTAASLPSHPTVLLTPPVQLIQS